MKKSQSRLVKQAFQETHVIFKDDYLIIFVAIPPSKAGISRPSWEALCPIGNFVKKL